MDTQPSDDDYIPIQYRPGGARGGDYGGHHGRRRRSFEKRIQHKRAVIYDDDAHLNLLQNVVFDAVVSTDLPAIEFEKRSNFVKRMLVDDEGEVKEQEEEEEEEEEDNGEYFETPDVYAEGDDGVDEFLESKGDVEVHGEFNGIFEGQEVVDGDFENEEEEEEEEDEGEEGEYDEDEERRLDIEAGLQDWIEEMKSEEYFDLAGHPDGQDEEEEGEGEVHVYDEDEPSPSEEEIFAASWTH